MSDEVYEVNNLACSLPLVKMAAKMKLLNSGELFEFVTDNPCFEGDIRLWCRATGNTLCNLKRENGKTSVILMRN